MPGLKPDRPTQTELDVMQIDAKDEGRADHLEAIENQDPLAMESGDTPTFHKHVQKSALRKVSIFGIHDRA